MLMFAYHLKNYQATLAVHHAPSPSIPSSIYFSLSSRCLKLLTLFLCLVAAEISVGETNFSAEIEVPARKL